MQKELAFIVEDVAISWDLQDNKVFKARTVALLYQLHFKICSAKHFQVEQMHLTGIFFLQQNFLSPS